jgi:hypothetical protein
MVGQWGEQQRESVARASKGRSPSYPGIPLKVAVRRAKALYEAAHRQPRRIGDVTSLWGYKSPTSGPASVTYAALRKFGLLQDEGTGPDRMAKLTDLAAEIILESEPLPAIQMAALQPPIHRELWETYGVDLPPDDLLWWELVDQRGFTPSGFAEFIRQYRATMNYARLFGPGRLGSDDEPVNGATEDAGWSGQTDKASETHGPRRRAGMREGGVLTIRVPVIGGSTIIVEGSFPVTEAAWNQFLAVLAAMKPGLVAEPDRDQQANDSAV